jgi:hypothetical protein
VNLIGFVGGTIMRKRKLKARDNGDLDAKAVDALVEAQSMPAGSDRTEALAKAEKLRYAAEVYDYLFSSELKPPD